MTRLYYNHHFARPIYIQPPPKLTRKLSVRIVRHESWKWSNGFIYVSLLLIAKDYLLSEFYLYFLGIYIIKRMEVPFQIDTHISALIARCIF